MSARLTPLLPLSLALCLALCLTLSAAGSASAEELTPAKKADIQLLLKVSGSGAIGKQMGQMITRNLLQALRRSQPNIPAKALAIIERETVALVAEKVDAPGGVLDRMVPMYAEAYTHQEIRDLLAFYQSPTGKKAVAVTPGLMRSGEKIGQELAQGIGPELQRRIDAALQREGFKKKKP